MVGSLSFSTEFYFIPEVTSYKAGFKALEQRRFGDIGVRKTKLLKLFFSNKTRCMRRVASIILRSL